jgi:exosortase/archaeosortase family protein
LIVVNVARNFVTGTQVSFGLFDMLVAFIGLSIIFYGFAGFRRLWVPLVYILVLVSAYQLEFIAEEVQTLEFFLAQLMTMSMNALGIKATLFTPQNVVQLYTPYGPYLLEIAGPCTGVKGMLAYGSLAVLMLLDEKASAKRKLAIALIGVAGTMFVNIMRLNVIFLVIYALGIDVGLFVHTYLGYTLFLAWVMIFWTVAFQHLGPRPTSPMMRHGANTSPSLTR